MVQRSSMRNRGSRNAKGRWRGRVAGLVGAAGAFVAFGLSPLAAVPSAHADPLTDLIDVLIEPAIAASSGISPAEFLDPGVLAGALSELVTPSGWDTVVSDLSSIGTSLVGVPDTGAAVSGSSSFVQGLEQDWITSPFGSQVDSSLNAWAAQTDPAAISSVGACGLICNGADGVGGGTLAQADGQGGGIWFGDGGNGATDAAGDGGSGGDAVIGQGGNAGDGVDGGEIGRAHV